MYNYYLIYANNQALLCSLTIFRAVFMLPNSNFSSIIKCEFDGSAIICKVTVLYFLPNCFWIPEKLSS